ncbi:MAG: tyrosyl-tRNA synthetase [Actinomycetota bacterium]|jgi:tyrosyl-tRNA synthetase
MDLLSELDARGLVHDATDRTALASRLGAGGVGVYVGFDPTADSLHVGHLLGQIGLRRMQLAGHRVFPLAGGATGMVGDPSGRSEERNLLTRDELAHNVASISRQLERILDFSGPNPATLVDNAEWTASVTLLDFLRDVGKHVSVSQMLGKDSVRSRLGAEGGLSFTEFSYMLLQANDFRHLHDAHGVEMQMGGSDQWGNITAGIDLIRRTSGGSAHGLTWPLLTKADGTKFGKTASGAVWLDPARTSPYQFRQFWVQTDDADVADRLLRFSLAPLDEITQLVTAHAEAPHERRAQRALAAELTSLVHGREALAAAEAAAEALFGGAPGAVDEAALEVIAAEVGRTEVASADLADLPAVLVSIGLAASKGEARRTLEGRGYRCNGAPIEADRNLADLPLLPGGHLLIQRGRTSHHLIRIFS